LHVSQSTVLCRSGAQGYRKDAASFRNQSRRPPRQLLYGLPYPKIIHSAQISVNLDCLSRSPHSICSAKSSETRPSSRPWLRSRQGAEKWLAAKSVRPHADLYGGRQRRCSPSCLRPCQSRSSEPPHANTQRYTLGCDMRHGLLQGMLAGLLHLLRSTLLQCVFPALLQPMLPITSTTHQNT